MLASQGFLVAGGGARDAELGLSPPHDGFVSGQILDRRAGVDRGVDALLAALGDGAALGVVLVAAHDGCRRFALGPAHGVTRQHHSVVLEEVDVTLERVGHAQRMAGVGVDLHAITSQCECLAMPRNARRLFLFCLLRNGSLTLP
jgi:hypothetical protein